MTFEGEESRGHADFNKVKGFRVYHLGDEVQSFRDKNLGK
jgi:hypothetical protein